MRPARNAQTSWSGRPDLNRRSLHPQCSALTKLGHVPSRSAARTPTLAQRLTTHETTAEQPDVAPRSRRRDALPFRLGRTFASGRPGMWGGGRLVLTVRYAS